MHLCTSQLLRRDLDSHHPEERAPDLVLYGKLAPYKADRCTSMHLVPRLRGQLHHLRDSASCVLATRSASTSASEWSVQNLWKETGAKAASVVENAFSGAGAWSVDSMPDQSGKTFLVTGANSGIGFQAAKGLAQNNASVILAGRNESSGQRAVDEIMRVSPGSQVQFRKVDLESFRSIQQFADSFLADDQRLDCLINNAGVFMPQHRKTSEGFEVTLATNYFGPFFLTHLLLDRLKASAPSRVVWVVSSLETVGDIQWNDLKGHYAKRSDLTAYGTSKLMTIMAHTEMTQRLKDTGLESFICQPGMTSTPVYEKTDKTQVLANVLDAAQKVMGQTEDRGAIPLMYTATAPELAGKAGTYIGPYYVGPFTTNLFNAGSQAPLNKWASDSAACTRMYNETVQLIHDAVGHQPPTNAASL